MGSHQSTNVQKSDQNVGASSPTVKTGPIERRSSLSREGSKHVKQHERTNNNENNSQSPRKEAIPQEVAHRKRESFDLSDYTFSLIALLSLYDFHELFKKFIDNNDEWREIFQAYLHFIDKVDNFQAKTSSVHRYQLAEDIVGEYIQPREQSHFLLLSEKVREEILDEFSFCSEQVIPSKLFDEAYNEAIQQLSDGPFSQFIKTKEFRQFIKEKMNQKGENFLSNIAEVSRNTKAS